MFTDVRSRNDDLCLANIVILNKDNLEEITDVFIIINNLAHCSDQTNNGFRLRYVSIFVCAEPLEAGRTIQ